MNDTVNFNLGNPYMAVIDNLNSQIERLKHMLEKFYSRDVDEFDINSELIKTALKDGIVLKDTHGNRITALCTVECIPDLLEQGCDTYHLVTQYGMYRIKDHGVTWWLQSDINNEEE